MTSIGLYLLKTGVVSAIFILIYHFTLRKESFFRLNRFYLLFSLMFAYAFPFMKLGIEIPSYEAMPMVNALQGTVNDFTFMEEVQFNGSMVEASFAGRYWLMFVLLFISAIFLFRFLKHLFQIRKTIYAYDKIKHSKFTLVLFNQRHTFSFFRYIFISQPVWHSPNGNSILSHELSHIKHKHSIDRLIVELLQIAFWMNPFIYMYRKALEEVHEFQADNDATKTSTSKTDYFNLVLQQSSPEYYSPLMSPFSYKLIKKRITMSNYKSNPFKRLLFIMPLTLATLILLISGTTLTQGEEFNQVKNTPDQLIGQTELTILPVKSIENHILLDLDENDDKTIFISPLKQDARFKITSSYGMRMHPIKKKEMMHRGIDYKAEINTPVVAIGDGTVRKVELHFENGKGYGKFIIIDHPNGFSSLYAQLNEYKIKEGDIVKKGDIIALVGSSGMSTGPHLHLELKKDGQYVDPAQYIK